MNGFDCIRTRVGQCVYIHNYDFVVTVCTRTNLPEYLSWLRTTLGRNWSARLAPLGLMHRTKYGLACPSEVIREWRDSYKDTKRQWNS